MEQLVMKSPQQQPSRSSANDAPVIGDGSLSTAGEITTKQYNQPAQKVLNLSSGIESIRGDQE